jgi:hypothetical protein
MAAAAAVHRCAMRGLLVRKDMLIIAQTLLPLASIIFGVLLLCHASMQNDQLNSPARQGMSTDLSGTL